MTFFKKSIIIPLGDNMRRSTKRKIFAITILLIICYFLVSTVLNAVETINFRKTYQFKLTTHGYDETTVKYFEDYFETKYLDYLLEMEVNEHIKPLTEERYFILKKLDQYLAYIDANDIADYTSVVAIINTGVDQEFYKNVKPANTKVSPYHILANKYYQLDASYKPAEVILISNLYAYANRSIDASIYDTFKAMWQAAKDDGATLIVISGYRSYEEQEKLFENYLKTDGRAEAERYSAKAGHSEHQLGYALDLVTHGYGLVPEFDETKEFAWLSEHAHRYGFILRYPKEKEYITGYGYEPWHFRYVGEEVATYIHEHDITFDEYYAFYIAN